MACRLDIEIRNGPESSGKILLALSACHLQVVEKRKNGAFDDVVEKGVLVLEVIIENRFRDTGGIDDLPNGCRFIPLMAEEFYRLPDNAFPSAFRVGFNLVFWLFFQWDLTLGIRSCLEICFEEGSDPPISNFQIIEILFQ